MKAPTFSQFKYYVPVSYSQWTLNPVYAGKLWAIDPSKHPVAPKNIDTLYLPSIGEV